MVEIKTFQIIQMMNFFNAFSFKRNSTTVYGLTGNTAIDTDVKCSEEMSAVTWLVSVLLHLKCCQNYHVSNILCE